MSEIKWFSDDPTHKYYDKNSLYKHYEDDVWGIPPHNDRSIFEQYTIGMFAADVDALLKDKGVIRNRRKLEAVIWNAKVVQKLQRRYGSLDNYFWSQVDYKQERNDVENLAELGTTNKKGDRLAKQIKKDGFKYVGPVSVWSFMNAIGLVSSRIDKKGIEDHPRDHIKKTADQGENTFNLR